MKISYLYFWVILLYHSILFSQNNLSGVISSEGKPVEYAILHIKNSPIIKYADEYGNFEITRLSRNDTLIIECIGYISKEIPLKKQSNELIIELEQNTELLKEVVISINNNEKSKWRKVNKRTKRCDQTYQGLPEGYKLVSTFNVEKEIKINGIRLFIMVNTLNPDLTLNRSFKKVVKPILIINSKNLEDNYFLNTTVPLNKDEKEFSKFDIEFANTLHLQSGETLTIGLELIPENLEKPNNDNVLGILTTKHLLKESKTYLTNLFSKKQGILHDKQLNEDIYFELKIVK